MAIHSVYLVGDEDNSAPPTRVLKVALFLGGYTVHANEYMEPVIHFAIGEFDESTFEDSFKSSEAQTFSVTLEDLVRALGGLGVFDKMEYGSLVELP